MAARLWSSFGCLRHTGSFSEPQSMRRRLARASRARQVAVLLYSKRVTLLALKQVYQVALFNNIYSIDSNIYKHVIQIKAMVIFRMH